MPDKKQVPLPSSGGSYTRQKAGALKLDKARSPQAAAKTKTTSKPKEEQTDG